MANGLFIFAYLISVGTIAIRMGLGFKGLGI